MSEGSDWLDNFSQQVEEAVALKAILGDDFALDRLEDLPVDPEAIYEKLHSLRKECLPKKELSFRVHIDVTLPQEEIDVQVGEHGAYSQRVKFLPPIAASFLLPHDYPSTCPPCVSVDAAWLSTNQAQELEAELLGMAARDQGFPVCYTLISWLEASALERIGVTNTLVLSGDGEPETAGQSFSDAASGSHRSSDDGNGAHGRRLPEDVFRLLLRFNAARLRQSMLEGTWQCLICFEDIPGSRCVQGAACSHLFCEGCMQGHCRTHIRENRVDKLLCPDPACKEPLIRDRLVGLLESEEAQRWEDAELQATLLKMEDVVFCPRCNAPTIEDPDNNALCSKCHFAFCSLCQSAYHPGERCMSVETKLKILRERMDGRKDGQVLLQLKRKEEELLSLASVQKMSKPCPVCSSAISKTEGCNKMTCSYCGAFFCWACNQRVSGYDHFRADGCVLFDDEEVQRWNAQFGPIDMEMQPGLGPPRAEGGAAIRARPCPQCGQYNAKRGNLNMMACYACSTRYCYLCAKILRRGEGATHFRPTGCRQHSPD